MDTASPDGFGDVAYNVEQCQCPSQYVGTSCEVKCIFLLTKLLGYEQQKGFTVMNDTVAFFNEL